MSELATARGPWTARRRRTAELSRRYPFATQQLTLYASLLEVQELIFEEALASPPAEADLVPYLVGRVLPAVCEATMRAGPESLRLGIVARVDAVDLEDVYWRWLRSEEQQPVDRYLARASLAPVLEAAPALGRLCSGPRDLLHCPTCGGLPQLSYLSQSAEELVSGPRCLLCSRCLGSWIYPRSACAACGEKSSSRLRVLAEEEKPIFPQIRVDACDSCRRYLLSIDLRRDATALPVVDELAAAPLDLYARDHGLTKVMPNLMGI